MPHPLPYGQSSNVGKNRQFVPFRLSSSPKSKLGHYPLSGELAAIEARVKAAVKDEEKRVLKSQFGQRIEHLADRIKALAGSAAPPAS